jgi:DNA ligase-1
VCLEIDGFNYRVSLCHPLHITLHLLNSNTTLRYKVFDAPAHKGSCEERFAELQRRLGPLDTSIVEVVDQVVCDSSDDLTVELKRIEGLGGEGLMVRDPKAAYTGTRSSKILKVNRMVEECLIGL